MVPRVDVAIFAADQPTEGAARIRSYTLDQSSNALPLKSERVNGSRDGTGTTHASQSHSLLVHGPQHTSPTIWGEGSAESSAHHLKI